MTTQLEQAARLALEVWDRPHGINYVDFRPYMDALRAALSDAALERMAENARELGLNYDQPKYHTYSKGVRVDPVTGDVGIGTPQQPAQDGGACPTCGAWHDDQIIKQPAQDEPVECMCGICKLGKREPLTDEQKDAARWRFLVDNSFDKESITQFHVWEHSWEPHSQTGEPTEWKQRVRGPALDRFIDRAIEAAHGIGEKK